jgi:hypothetical protein
VRSNEDKTVSTTRFGDLDPTAGETKKPLAGQGVRGVEMRGVEPLTS